jgi:NitT/TauT family transport system substrate-binding protein
MIARLPLLTALFGAALLALAPPTAAQQKQKFSFGNAAPVALSSAQVVVADQLGYFAEEGLELELKIFPGGANTVAQTVNKQADVSYPGNEPVIIGKQKGRDPLPVKFFYNAVPTVIWELVVQDASPVKTLKDLQGKRIGIFAPSASNVPQVKAILRREGINPDGGVTMRSIGLGAGALNALTSNTVDVVALYDTEHATFETSGTKLRRLPVSPVIEKLFSNGFLTHEDNLKDPAKRKMLVGVGRAFAKATLYCEINPKGCIELVWKAYPQVKPTGVDEKRAMEDSLFVFASRDGNMKLRDYQKGQYGLYDPAAWQAYVDFMLAEKELEQPVELASLYTNELIADINAFDRAAVQRKARGQ